MKITGNPATQYSPESMPEIKPGQRKIALLKQKLNLHAHFTLPTHHQPNHAKQKSSPIANPTISLPLNEETIKTEQFTQTHDVFAFIKSGMEKLVQAISSSVKKSFTFLKSAFQTESPASSIPPPPPLPPANYKKSQIPRSGSGSEKQSQTPVESGQKTDETKSNPKLDLTELDRLRGGLKKTGHDLSDIPEKPEALTIPEAVKPATLPASRTTNTPHLPQTIPLIRSEQIKNLKPPVEPAGRSVEKEPPPLPPSRTIHSVQSTQLKQMKVSPDPLKESASSIPQMPDQRIESNVPVGISSSPLEKGEPENKILQDISGSEIPIPPPLPPPKIKTSSLRIPSAPKKPVKETTPPMQSGSDSPDIDIRALMNLRRLKMKEKGTKTKKQNAEIAALDKRASLESGSSANLPDSKAEVESKREEKPSSASLSSSGIIPPPPAPPPPLSRGAKTKPIRASDGTKMKKSENEAPGEKWLDQIKNRTVPLKKTEPIAPKTNKSTENLSKKIEEKVRMKNAPEEVAHDMESSDEEWDD